ncbi:unnamed protein product [Porites lobata]|uniref:Uncharacterized protein n=1 Tax=Porites lobata TaxID=104759 RepID=A0ABN8S0A3_9CNID|nr:unnamed protein product [Porites lobata]
MFLRMSGFALADVTRRLPNVENVEKLVLTFFTTLFFRNNSMKWTVEHDLTLCGEVLLQEPFKHPKNSKEGGEVWSNIAVNLNSLENPSFKVSKRSVRDRLTLLQTKYKGKVREEEKASGIDCEETSLDAAIEEILEKEKAADMERNEQSGTQTLKEQREKASAEEVRRQAMERLGKTQKRNADSEEGKPSKKSKEKKLRCC